MRFERFSDSSILFGGLLVALILLRAIFSFLPDQELLPGQASLLTWPAVLIIIGLALAGNYLARRTGFPRMWDAAVETWRRLLFPAVTGFVLDLVWILMETSGVFDVVLPTLPTSSAASASLPRSPPASHFTCSGTSSLPACCRPDIELYRTYTPFSVPLPMRKSTSPVRLLVEIGTQD